MKLRFFIPILFLLIASCAPFSQDIMQEVKKDIAFGEVIKAPDAFKGESVLWGGVIIEAIPKPDDTMIIVSQTELDYQKRPRDVDQSGGRFIIHYRGFLDPAIYGKGREVTVVGTIEGKEERPIGDRLYAYPVVAGHALRLWEKWEPLPYYYDPWYRWDPFYYPWRYYPRYRR